MRANGTGFKSGAAHPKWKAGSFIDRDGYVVLAPSLRIGKSKKEHRVVAERAIGKPLAAKHPVHHHDEDRSNNANANLVICESLGYHKTLHARMRVLKAGGDPDKQKYCYTCSRLLEFAFFTKDAARARSLSPLCKDCQKARRNQRRLAAEKD